MAHLNDIMCDLETLATIADAPIMSIGAVRFDPWGDALADTGFYRSITLESNFDYHRRPSESTIKWWMGQSEGAKKVFGEEKVGLDTALAEFTEWVYMGEQNKHKRQRIKKDAVLWANGPEFDTAMIAHAMAYARVEFPFEYWNSRCVRTYKALPGANACKVERVGTYHNALGDAITQAQLIQLINRTVFPPQRNAFGAEKKRT